MSGDYQAMATRGGSRRKDRCCQDLCIARYSTRDGMIRNLVAVAVAVAGGIGLATKTSEN